MSIGLYRLDFKNESPTSAASSEILTVLRTAMCCLAGSTQEDLLTNPDAVRGTLREVLGSSRMQFAKEKLDAVLDRIESLKSRTCPFTIRSMLFLAEKREFIGRKRPPSEASESF